MINATIINLGNLDLSSETETAPVVIDLNHSWSISPLLNNVNGNVGYTVFVSHDNDTYHEYTPFVDVELENYCEGVVFPWKYIKIIVSSQGQPPSGIVSFSMLLKNN